MKIYLDKELFQWEKNRSILIEEDYGQKLTFVQFENGKSKKGLLVPIQNGAAKIPDSLLRENLPIIANICSGPREETRVVTRKQFKVLSRSKPESYVYEEDIIKEIVYDGGEES